MSKKHGPYLYAYWKEGNKTKSRYVGKNLEDFDFRKIAKDCDLRPSQLLKFNFIKQELPGIMYWPNNTSRN
ncbi:MAG: hypothetical protein WBZ36_11715 [Candidatus Nitrosopolaris sp.]|jgi:hypothetical protein